MTTIQQVIAKAHFVATEAQVEQLAAAQWACAKGTEEHNATYLKVLVAGAQARTGTTKRGRAPTKDAQLTVLREVNGLFYAAVLRGLIGADPTIAADDSLEQREKSLRALERNRRSTFARTSYRELVGFVERGGDLRGLDVEAVTKGALRAFGRAAEPVDRTERTLERSQGAILRAINRMARASPEEALERLDAVLEALQARRHELANKAPVKREPRHVRTRVGVPQFTSPGAQ